MKNRDRLKNGEPLVPIQKYSFPTDIWSLGIILYEMCCLEYPFQPKDTDNDPMFGLMKSVMKGKYEDMPA